MYEPKVKLGTTLTPALGDIAKYYKSVTPKWKIASSKPKTSEPEDEYVPRTLEPEMYSKEPGIPTKIPIEYVK